MNEILTVQEVSERLRLTTETIRRLIKQGVLAGFRAGRSYRVPSAAVERMVTGGVEKELPSHHAGAPAPERTAHVGDHEERQ